MNITSISLQSGETVTTTTTSTTTSSSTNQHFLTSETILPNTDLSTTTTTSLENRDVLEAIMSDLTAQHSLKELVDASKEQYVSIV